MHGTPHHRSAPALAVGIGLAVLAGLVSPSGAAETWISLPAFEVGAYRFVSEADDATSIFLNPGGLATGHGTNLYVDLTGDDNEVAESVTALQGGAWGFAYRHRDLGFRGETATFLDGAGLPVRTGNLDSYILASSFGPPSFQIGTARVWDNTDLPGHDGRGWQVGVMSRVSRHLSLGGMIRNIDKPRFLDGRLRPQYTYGISVRPLPARPELLTLSIQGTHGDGDPDKIDLAYGAHVRLDSGVDLGLSVQDPRAGDLRLGASVTTHFGHGASSARVRSVAGSKNYRANTSIQVFDEFWERSMAPGKAVATLDLNGRFDDEGSGFVLLGASTRGTRDLVRRIGLAARDRDIRGLAIRVGDVAGAFIGPVDAHHEEIREALVRFRESGKPVVAYLDQLSGPTELYLASGADWIVLPPLGTVRGVGASLTLKRYGKAFEKLGVGWDARTAGDYKSSFHTWYTDSTTAEQREAIQSLVDGAFDHLVDTLRESRHLAPGDLDSIATGGLLLPEYCLRTGLVDQIGWWEDALAAADSLAGGPGRTPPTEALPRRDYWTERWTPAPAVAVVPVSGGIGSGHSRRNWVLGGRSMGSKTVVRQLKSAAGHPGVRAIVFRVDSGGGSALASEEIRQEILKIRKRGIPFLVSMGSMAGSGGYWISMDGEEIFANATTLTGSIGVVWSYPVLEDLYDRLGVTTEIYKRGEHSDVPNLARHLTEEEEQLVDASVNFVYDRFVAGVAAGRGLDEARVREIAGGRVYLGTQAREVGLVDRLGGLEDAVQRAAEKAGIAGDYRVVTVSAGRPGLVQKVLTRIAGFGGGIDPGLASAVSVIDEP